MGDTSETSPCCRAQGTGHKCLMFIMVHSESTNAVSPPNLSNLRSGGIDVLAKECRIDLFKLVFLAAVLEMGQTFH